ncbi:hypothetical protein M0802_016904 [Mischocyttarus mexicanus]|nr:hypothetical protein M0802_016904 [Mischocyttarus mexicanus]
MGQSGNGNGVEWGGVTKRVGKERKGWKSRETDSKFPKGKYTVQRESSRVRLPVDEISL